MFKKRFHFERTFGCCYEQKIEYFPTVCRKCPYNSFMFGKNYFACKGCPCLFASKEMISAFCSYLKEHVKKVSIEVNNKSDLPSQVIPLKNTCAI